MKVKELIEELSKLDPEIGIILSTDPEGNSYNIFNGRLAVMQFVDNETVKYRELTPQLLKYGYGEEDVTTEGETVVVLWP